jgi:tetratricopeptide (TPR) repeat protein
VSLARRPALSLVAVPTEWFRSPDWSPAAREGFERRLARAREHNRPQYLRIKALALLDSPVPDIRAAGRGLLDRLITECAGTSPLEACFAHELLGDAYRREGKLDEAESHYRACMHLARPDRSGTSHLYDLSLAEVLLAAPESRTAEAGDLLEQVRTFMQSRPGGWFHSELFRYEVAVARLAAKTGDRQRAAASARKALELAAIDQPQLSRHPDVGVVRTNDATLGELRLLADTPDQIAR